MAEFTLDTSGEVLAQRASSGGPFAFHWSDLDAFTQGYVEALFASIADVKTPWGAGYDVVRALRFSDLAPETLAAILKDCAEAVEALTLPHFSALVGEAFFRNRQRGLHPAFPPLSASLGDDGKVRLS